MGPGFDPQWGHHVDGHPWPVKTHPWQLVPPLICP